MASASTKKVWQSQAQMQLAAWLKDGTAVKTDLSMDPKVLKPDPERLQSRVETDPEHARALAEVLERGEELRPVTVFQEPDTGKYLLADGFHRHWAYRKHKRASIPAYVVKGGLDEAIKFSASANLEFSKVPSMEDRKKACRMLLATDDGVRMSSPLLGELCGLSESTVKLVRRQWHAETGVPVPDRLLGRRGGLINDPYEPKAYTRATKNGTYTSYAKGIRGKIYHLGSDYEKARKKLAVLVQELGVAETGRAVYVRQKASGKGLSSKSMGGRLDRRKLYPKIQGSGISSQSLSERIGFKSLSGVVINGGVLAVPVERSTSPDLLKAIGVIALARKSVPGIQRSVICYSPEWDSTLALWIVRIASAPTDPIEFMTPEELIAEFGPK